MITINYKNENEWILVIAEDATLNISNLPKYAI
jgi:hypothetical protein